MMIKRIKRVENKKFTFTVIGLIYLSWTSCGIGCSDGLSDCFSRSLYILLF